MMSSSSLELAYGLLAPLLVLLFSIKLSNSSSIFESELSCFPFPFLAAADEEPLVLISLNKSSASSLSLLSILYLVVALLRLTLSRAIGATSDRSPPPSESESIFSSSSLDSQGFFLFFLAFFGLFFSEGLDFSFLTLGLAAAAGFFFSGVKPTFSLKLRFASLSLIISSNSSFSSSISFSILRATLLALRSLMAFLPPFFLPFPTISRLPSS